MSNFSSMADELRKKAAANKASASGSPSTASGNAAKLNQQNQAMALKSQQGSFTANPPDASPAGNSDTKLNSNMANLKTRQGSFTANPPDASPAGNSDTKIGFGKNKGKFGKGRASRGSGPVTPAVLQKAAQVKLNFKKKPIMNARKTK
jgi:hypothetical protein